MTTSLATLTARCLSIRLSDLFECQAVGALIFLSVIDIDCATRLLGHELVSLFGMGEVVETTVASVHL